MNYPLASSTWDDSEHNAIMRVVKSGNFSMGQEVAKFEKQFAEWAGSRHAIMVNSGSSANLLMIASLMFRREAPLMAGDEVIVPAISWSTTYFPLQQYGLKLKFVDIDHETLNFDLTELADAVSTTTRAILAVNLLGNPNNFREIRRIISGHDIILLEDNCESLGAVYDDKKTGTYGLMGTFSCFFSHHISTMEGGLVVTDDEELWHIMLCLRAHGWTRNLPEKNFVSGVKSKNIFDESFRFVLPGYNLRPLEISGAVGQAQLVKVSSLLAVRRSNAVYFSHRFDSHPWLKVQKEIGQSSWFGFSLILTEDAPVNRTKVIQKLLSADVEVRPIVGGNFAKNEVLKWFNYTIHGKLRNAEYIDKNGFFVGNHHFPLEEQIDHLWSQLC